MAWIDSSGQIHQQEPPSVVFTSRAYNTMKILRKRHRACCGSLIGHLINNVWVILETLPATIDRATPRQFLSYSDDTIFTISEYIYDIYEKTPRWLGIWMSGVRFDPDDYCWPPEEVLFVNCTDNLFIHTTFHNIGINNIYVGDTAIPEELIALKDFQTIDTSPLL